LNQAPKILDARQALNLELTFGFMILGLGFSKYNFGLKEMVISDE
jgi:hypothetical protein